MISLHMTTPEYLPPEVLQYLEAQGYQNKNPFISFEKLNKWSIDIWSLGIVLLELVIGFPIYMAYKGKIKREETGKSSFLQTGLFSSTQRQG